MMRRHRFVLLLATIAIATTATTRADERGFVGKKLLLVDKHEPRGNVKVLVLAKDKTLNAIHKGPEGAAASLSGTIEIFSLADPGNRAVYALGAPGSWINKATVARYKNKSAAIGGVGAKRVILKPSRILKLLAKSLGDGDLGTADDGPSDLVLATLTPTDTLRVVARIVNTADAEPHVMCTDFSGLAVKAIAKGRGIKVTASTATAPTECTIACVTSAACGPNGFCAERVAVNMGKPDLRCTFGNPGATPLLESCSADDDCESGLCLAGLCTKACSDEAECEGGQCLASDDVNATGLCYEPACDPLVQDCDGAEGCYLRLNDGATFCGPPIPPGVQGDACNALNTCAVGYGCVLPGDFNTGDGRQCAFFCGAGVPGPACFEGPGPAFNCISLQMVWGDLPPELPASIGVCVDPADFP